MHTSILAVASLAVASFAAVSAAPVTITALAAANNNNNTATNGQCNVGCIPKGTKKKNGQSLCCTEGHTTFKCPAPAYYQCGPAPPSLWFKSYRSKYSTGIGLFEPTCGEVNAAPFMSPDLFESKNHAYLLAYERFTIAGFGGGGDGGLNLGRCADPLVPFDPNYNLVTNIGQVPFTILAKTSAPQFWDAPYTTSSTKSSMQDLCSKQCGCCYPNTFYTCSSNFPPAGKPGNGQPKCTDVPDEPKKGKFCSLCGPTLNGRYKVNVFKQANVVQLAQSVPTLSTLVSAVVAGNLAATLSGTGQNDWFTVFAPNNAAFEKLPAALLAKLLRPENVRDLVNVLELHVVKTKCCAPLYAKDLKETAAAGKTLKTINGLELTVTVKGGDIFIGSGFTAASKVISGDNPASNGVAHIIDTVLIPAKGPDPLPNQCNPDAGKCNVCKACCQSYITSAASCDECVNSEC